MKQNTRAATGGLLAFAALAFALGLVVGWFDVRTTEVWTTILLLLGAGFALGALRPEGAWRWALLLVAGIPIVAAIAIATGAQTAEPAQLDPRIVLISLVFALLGCYAGVFVRRAARALAAPKNGVAQ